MCMLRMVLCAARSQNPEQETKAVLIDRQVLDIEKANSDKTDLKEPDINICKEEEASIDVRKAEIHF